MTFVRGEGSWLVDADGRRYLDLVAGIAVVGLGHGHDAPLAAAPAQLDRLWHVSNLYWTEPMAALAERLSDRFGGAQAFFCNSGAEAVEAALKYARKATGRPGIVALEGSFHGRTLGALSVTGQPAKRAAFAPLVPGVRVRAAERRRRRSRPRPGPRPAASCSSRSRARAASTASTTSSSSPRASWPTSTARCSSSTRCRPASAAPGTFFAWEQLGVRPDAVTLAKGLANGLPIGCLLVADEAPPRLRARRPR